MTEITQEVYDLPNKEIVVFVPALSLQQQLLRDDKAPPFSATFSRAIRSDLDQIEHSGLCDV